MIIQYKKSQSYRERFGMKQNWNFPRVSNCIKLDSGNSSSLLRRKHSNPTQCLAALSQIFRWMNCKNFAQSFNVSALCLTLPTDR